ncbi:DNA phosphorothioation-associated protein 4 [Pseudomonas sp. IT-196MI5]|uniref:hypothetical protein n=1 Tax=Pseudomonas sp. IT-196MI5 TaxID=3026440 RepID=UPI0039E1B65E
MKGTNFNWDKFAQKASFDEVRGLLVHAGRIPSMYNPERTELYLSSMDQAVGVDDIEQLKNIANEIKDYLESIGSGSLSDLRKIVDLRTDHNEISNLLYGLGQEFEPLNL